MHPQHQYDGGSTLPIMNLCSPDRQSQETIWLVVRNNCNTKGMEKPPTELGTKLHWQKKQDHEHQ
eukprot:8497485-Ditylum_brightwellii.AAC.1